MSELEEALLNALMKHCYSCPLGDDSIDFEKECVGYKEAGCKECIVRNFDKLD